MEIKFVADCMLGKLAKWLRALGYDTHYQRYYRPGDIDQLVKKGRHLLSRHKRITDHYVNALLIHSNGVGGQIAELKEMVYFEPDQSNWFSRCLICNVLLTEAQEDTAREDVPEYVFYENMTGIQFCPSCRRYYWPGSHRTRMVRQMKEWGL
jgi:uncharacterized protein with PIN domain